MSKTKLSLQLSESAYEVYRSNTNTKARWQRWFKPVGAYSDYRSSALRESGQIVDRQDLDRRYIQTAVLLDDEDLLNLLETWAWLNVWADNRVFSWNKRRPVERTRAQLIKEIRMMSDWWDETCQEHAGQYADEFLATIVEKERVPNYSRMASLLLEAIASDYIHVEGESLAE